MDRDYHTQLLNFNHVGNKANNWNRSRGLPSSYIIIISIIIIIVMHDDINLCV
jgi:hypothetical protein